MMTTEDLKLLQDFFERYPLVRDVVSVLQDKFGNNIYAVALWEGCDKLLLMCDNQNIEKEDVVTAVRKVFPGYDEEAGDSGMYNVSATLTEPLVNCKDIWNLSEEMANGRI